MYSSEASERVGYQVGIELRTTPSDVPLQKKLARVWHQGIQDDDLVPLSRRLSVRRQVEHSYAPDTTEEERRVLQGKSIWHSDRPSVTYRIVEQWEGRVLSVEAKDFEAELLHVDKRTGRTTSGRAMRTRFFLEDVSDGDRGILLPGALFMFTVGYKTEMGQRSRDMRIVVRRVPGVSNKRKAELEREALSLESYFSSINSNS